MTLVTIVLALAFTLDPLSIVLWPVIGLVAGFLASRVMRGGYGVVGDIVVGLIGALIGGFLAGLLGLGQFGLIGSIIVAFIGTCNLIAILRAVSGAGRRRRRRRSFQTAVSPGEKGSTLLRD